MICGVTGVSEEQGDSYVSGYSLAQLQASWGYKFGIGNFLEQRMTWVLNRF